MVKELVRKGSPLLEKYFYAFSWNDMSSSSSVLCNSVLRSNQAVHLAHISDLHLPPPQITWSRFFLNKRFLSLLLWKISRQHHHKLEITQELLQQIQKDKTLSALLISGDITNFGTPEEYSTSIKWLRSLTISPVLVPGNHDIMLAEPPKKTLDLWERWSGTAYPFVKFINHVAIIGVNSAIPTSYFKAYGHVSSNQLSKLDFLLEKLGKEGYCRVIMIHHPPKKGLLKKQKSLLNMEGLSNILNKRGAELVLHGHSHDATITKVDNTNIPLVGVSSASMNSTAKERRASWNSLLFTQKNGKHYIDLTRYDYKGEVMAQQQWLTPAKEYI